MLIRQNGPVFGSSNPYSQAGETQIVISTRNLRSTDHYNGDVEQVQRQTGDTYVVNLQHMIDVNLSHNFTERFSMSIGVPFVSSSWGIPSPQSGGRAARADEVGRGVGDISVSGRTWMLPTKRFTSGNIALGFGLKVPTGNEGAKDTYVDSAGNNPQPRFVDQSVQPGDGGWGLMIDVSGFKRIRYATLFGSVSYLANPRDRNATTSGSVNRSTFPNPPTTADTAFNSVPDQFMARAGAVVPIRRTGFAGSLAWRVEGMPRYDLIGASHGFRRPGVEMFLEPGFSYSKGSKFYSFQLPVGYYRNRFPNPYTGNTGDATFPKYIFLGSYGYRFGGKTEPNTSLTGAAALRTVAVGGGFKPFTLKTLEGTRKSLRDVLGTVTLIVFFYPTCPYCNIAAPQIQRLYDTYKAEGLSVIYINIYPEEEKLVPDWLAEHHYTASVLVGAKLDEMQRDYGISATPTHYLLDGTGKVLLKHSGYSSADTATLEREIKSALFEAARTTR